jgi:hypothetical protein
MRRRSRIRRRKIRRRRRRRKKGIECFLEGISRNWRRGRGRG